MLRLRACSTCMHATEYFIEFLLLQCSGCQLHAHLFCWCLSCAAHTGRPSSQNRSAMSYTRGGQGGVDARTSLVRRQPLARLHVIAGRILGCLRAAGARNPARAFACSVMRPQWRTQTTRSALHQTPQHILATVFSGRAWRPSALGRHDERDEAERHVADGQRGRAQQEQVHGGLHGRDRQRLRLCSCSIQELSCMPLETLYSSTSPPAAIVVLLSHPAMVI